ncbi:MAG: transposase [Planctomycetota bacterium]
MHSKRFALQSSPKREQTKRRRFAREFKEEAVQLRPDGHSATSVVERLGVSGAHLLSRWNRELIGQADKNAERLHSSLGYCCVNSKSGVGILPAIGKGRGKSQAGSLCYDVAPNLKRSCDAARPVALRIRTSIHQQSDR